MSKLARSSLSSLHSFVDKVFKDSEASKRISNLTNLRLSEPNEILDKFQSSPKAVYLETDEEDDLKIFELKLN